MPDGLTTVIDVSVGFLSTSTLLRLDVLHDAEFVGRAALILVRRTKMKKLLLLSAAAVLISTSAFAQSTVVTTTGTGHEAAVQIEPQYRTRIKSYVTEHHLRPITTKEKIIVGATVPGDVELEAVPSDWSADIPNCAATSRFRTARHLRKTWRRASPARMVCPKS
ncbi:hypothetical protein GGD61_007892 [Bradyrhizobium sp. SBR1B]|nr:MULTISPECIES: DUF1236 domain-containing protein [unclassified Bradyrhizobium]MBB4383193.1 hypothetical protein [Bradyrhizobium sp. SBR1B]